MAKVLIPAAEFRDRTRISETTEWRMRRDGTAPSWCRLGNRILYDHDAVEAFIQAKLNGESPDAKAAA